MTIHVDHAFRNILGVAALVLMAASCASSQPIQINPNEWLIQSRQLMPEAALKSAIAKAQKYCANRGQETKILETTNNGPAGDAYTRTNLRFSCIPAGRADSTASGAVRQ